MGAVFALPSREVREKALLIEDLVMPARASRERALDVAGETAQSLVARRQAWYQDIEDAVLDLSNVLPQGPEDYDARKLFQFLIELRRAMASDPDDRRGEVEVATARLRDVGSRIARRIDHERLDDPQAAVAWVFEAMTGVSARDTGRLLGVSEKTISAWRGGGVVERNIPRVVLVAQLLTYLRASMTPRGLMMWFDAPRPQLGDRTPMELLNEPAAAQEPLVSLARGIRAQLGS